MAAPRSPMVRAADVIAWLTATAAGLDADTEAIAHGGTALTLLRLKASTKDVDFGFSNRRRPYPPGIRRLRSRA